MIALAASRPLLADKRAAKSGNLAFIFSAGKATPIRPVEQTRIWLVAQPSTSAVPAASVLAAAMPQGPVQALALPLLRRTPRASLALRCALETRTGAALTRLVVNTPAATAGTSEATSAMSSRPLFEALMPAKTAPARNPFEAVTPPLIVLILLMPALCPRPNLARY